MKGFGWLRGWGLRRVDVDSLWVDDELSGRRRSIAWCGCGNVSVDGLNFSRVDGGLQCAACGTLSRHFEYVLRSAVEANLTGAVSAAEQVGPMIREGFELAESGERR